MVQRAPDRFSYLQGLLDEDPAPGRFILTGSEHFGLTESISQSLAGRIALLYLLPLGLDELGGFPSRPDDLWTTLWSGGLGGGPVVDPLARTAALPPSLRAHPGSRNTARSTQPS